MYKFLYKEANKRKKTEKKKRWSIKKSKEGLIEFSYDFGEILFMC